MGKYCSECGNPRLETFRDYEARTVVEEFKKKSKPKRKISDWQKFIKANSSKKKFKFANGKLKLKSMGIAYRKTAVYKSNKKK